jgi:hypothetical protein
MRLRNRERRRTLALIMLLASVISLAVFSGAGSGVIEAFAQGKFTPTPTPIFTLPPGGPYADAGMLGVGQTGTLLFTSERDGVFDLYVAAPDGSGERQLTFGHRLHRRRRRHGHLPDERRRLERPQHHQQPRL